MTPRDRLTPSMQGQISPMTCQNGISLSLALRTLAGLDWIGLIGNLTDTARWTGDLRGPPFPAGAGWLAWGPGATSPAPQPQPTNPGTYPLRDVISLLQLNFFLSTLNHLFSFCVCVRERERWAVLLLWCPVV